MANSTLAAIQIKVRRLTRSPSDSQLTTAQLNEYINTFVLYDFPEHLRLFNLHETFSFYTNPFIDVYGPSNDPNNVLYQFDQKYLTINPPIYVAGYPAFYTQSRAELFNIYPKIDSIASSGSVGNGATLTFTGYINTSQSFVPSNLTQQICILRNDVLFSSIDINGNGLSLIDYPISPTIGNLYIPGTTPTSTVIQDLNNYINYVTGQYVVTFPTAPAAGTNINSQVCLQTISRPSAVCFFDSKFIVRPVPDQPYKIDMEVYVRPTELLSEQSPKLQEWWQYIAYGAAKKVFEDRMDLESVALIMPEFKKQEALINRRTIVQNTNQRVATIYTQQTGLFAGPYGWGYGGGGPF